MAPIGCTSSRVTSGPVDAGVGVLAGGADYLADAAAICVSLPAIRLSHRSPTTGRPLGHPNATKVAALVNGGWLLVLSILVAPSAALRLVIAVIVGYALALVREVVAALRGAGLASGTGEVR
jgi:cobalt-zinc-cadmium efflux system protein